MDSDTPGVTQLLRQMGQGDAGAAEQLLPLVYGQLHRLAASCMRRERQDHTLQPTALINEAWLRLAGEGTDWQSREQFIGYAARVMRQVLVDHARAHQAERRAGGLQRVEMHDDLAVSADRIEEVLSIDRSLEQLAAENPRQARVVELRYFGGLSVEQIASLLGIAPRSVKRDWSLARLWLHRALTANDHPAPRIEK